MIRLPLFGRPSPDVNDQTPNIGVRVPISEFMELANAPKFILAVFQPL